MREKLQGDVVFEDEVVGAIDFADAAVADAVALGEDLAGRKRSGSATEMRDPPSRTAPVRVSGNPFTKPDTKVTFVDWQLPASDSRRHPAFLDIGNY